MPEHRPHAWNPGPHRRRRPDRPGPRPRARCSAASGRASSTRPPGPAQASRAMVVQARTLELYRQLGLAEAVIDRGIRVEALHLREAGAEVARVSLRDLGAGLSPYPFALSYPAGRPRALPGRAPARRRHRGRVEHRADRLHRGRRRHPRHAPPRRRRDRSRRAPISAAATARIAGCGRRSGSASPAAPMASSSTSPMSRLAGPFQPRPLASTCATRLRADAAGAQPRHEPADRRRPRRARRPPRPGLRGSPRRMPRRCSACASSR